MTIRYWTIAGSLVYHLFDRDDRGYTFCGIDVLGYGISTANTPQERRPDKRLCRRCAKSRDRRERDAMLEAHNDG